MNAKPRKLLINISIICSLLAAGCSGHKKETSPESTSLDSVVSEDNRLPHFGEFDLEFHKADDGTIITDTEYYAIPKFSFINQFGKETSFKDYQNFIFIAEFFFTECPGICPIMSSQMARLQELVRKENLQNQIKFISFSVKPEHDTPEILKEYGEKIGADFSTWSFVTGKTADIYELAEDGFMLSAFPSETAEGGVFHTDKLSLIDGDMHIRGYYDGTSTKSVDQLFSDVKKLIKEKNNDVTSSVTPEKR